MDDNEFRARVANLVKRRDEEHREAVTKFQLAKDQATAIANAQLVIAEEAARNEYVADYNDAETRWFADMLILEKEFRNG